MHFYLAPFVGTGTALDPFRPTGMPEFVRASCIDLRPDHTLADGYGVLCVDERNDALVQGSLYLGADADLDVISKAAQRAFSSKLLVTITSDTPRAIVTEFMTSGRVPHFKPVNGRWQQRIEGSMLFDAPVISGGAGPYVDDFNRADSTTLGAFSGGTVTWVELDAQWEISNSSAQLTTTAGDYYIAHMDTDLATDDHYVQAKITKITASAQIDGILLRKDGTATRTYYVADYRWTNNTLRYNKVVAGAITVLASLVEAQTSPFTLYAEHASNDQFTVKVGGVTKLGPTTDTAITGKFRTGLAFIPISAARAESADDFTTADLGGAVVVIVPGLAGGLVQSHEDALSPYRLVAA